MKKKIEIFCTLGPASLNKIFLRSVKNKVDLLRLNMSHIETKDLSKQIDFIRKYSKVPICIDTEGAQIRTKTNKKEFFRLGQAIKIFKENKKRSFYPSGTFEKLKIGDLMDIGFNDLKAKIIKKNKKVMVLKTISSGSFENNKGVNVSNREINLDFLTQKDLKAIGIGKKKNIKYYALSFTNTLEDIQKFNKIFKKEKKIFKIETKRAVKNIDKFFKIANNFLIDRGDLSKAILIENIPITQRLILKKSKKLKNKNIYVATNFLETMIYNKTPTRAEVNDIYNSIEMGSKGLVLSAETAIGKYPEKSVLFLKKMINVFKRHN